MEGHFEGVTGWSIGQREADAPTADAVNRRDPDDLYEKLGSEIVSIFYRHRERWIDVMHQSIALNASYFNTHRMRAAVRHQCKPGLNSVTHPADVTPRHDNE